MAENSALSRYHAPSRFNDDSGDRPNNGAPAGFVIQGAPWQKQNGNVNGGAEKSVPHSGDTQEFPSLGNGEATGMPVTAGAGSRWGAPR